MKKTPCIINIIIIIVGKINSHLVIRIVSSIATTNIMTVIIFATQVGNGVA